MGMGKATIGFWQLTGRDFATWQMIKKQERSHRIHSTVRKGTGDAKRADLIGLRWLLESDVCRWTSPVVDPVIEET